MKIKVIGEVCDLGRGLDEIPLKGKEFEAICNHEKTTYWVFHRESVFSLKAEDVKVMATHGSDLKDIVTLGGQSLKSIELKFR